MIVHRSIYYVLLSFLFVMFNGCGDSGFVQQKKEEESIGLAQKFVPPKIEAKKNTLLLSLTPPSIN